MMNEHDLMNCLEQDLQSELWHNPKHRAKLRRRVMDQAAWTPRRYSKSRSLIIAIITIALLTSSGIAAWRFWHTYILQANHNGVPIDIEIPVDETGKATLAFIPEKGEAQTLTISPDMVNEQGVIQDLHWNINSINEHHDDDKPDE